MQKRRRFKHTTSLEERLADQAQRLREEAIDLPAGVEREGLLRKARQLEAASRMTEWLTSPSPSPTGAGGQH